MNRDQSRRKARAIAISASAEAQRTFAVIKALGFVALCLWVVDAMWVAHTVIAR